MNTVLDVISGISWSLVYITAIFLGIRHKTWCIPKLAICQNFAWEFWVVFNRFKIGATQSVAYAIQLVWFLLDIVILFTWLYFDRRKDRQLSKNISLLLVVFAAMYLLAYRAEKWEFSAFLINAIMSAAFIVRASKSPGLRQSTVISIGKLIGTLAATILNGIIYWNPLLLWLGGLCFLFDCYYLSMLHRQRMNIG